MQTTATRNLLATTILALICAVALTSCDSDDDYDYGYLTGLWVYQGDASGNYFAGYENEFFFSPDGTGTYSCYSDSGSGPWTTYPINWWADRYSLTVEVLGWAIWQYDYDLSPGWLYLYPADGGPYLIYNRN
ncbi:MAG: hypothetical protein NC336_09125 [Clostridium sp.]|nr:hypothetical protein [Clostridium sp.]